MTGQEEKATIGKDAAIVDERFNAGGLLATDIAEILDRKPLSAAANRVGNVDRRLSIRHGLVSCLAFSSPNSRVLHADIAAF